MAIEVDYKGEKLNYISDFHGHKVLWITDPLQKDMEHMTFVGGYPNEYCIYLKDLPVVDRYAIYKQVNGYDYAVIAVEERHTIGPKWRAGLFKGKVGSEEKFFLYYGSPVRNETFYAIAEITSNDYKSIQKQNEEYLDKPGVRDLPTEVCVKVKDAVDKNIVWEGWNLI
jgi:hypothetical protein